MTHFSSFPSMAELEGSVSRRRVLKDRVAHKLSRLAELGSSPKALRPEEEYGREGEGDVLVEMEDTSPCRRAPPEVDPPSGIDSA